MSSQPSSVIFTGGRNAAQSNNVSIGEINIKTQATDADGLSKALGQSIDSQMRQVTSNFDDGIRG